MADLENMNVETSTIAVIIEPSTEPRFIQPKEFEEVLSRPVSISQIPSGLVAGSQRDQIEAVVSVNKIDVKDLSGKTDFGKSKIPSVLHFILGTPPPKIISYGVNFIVAVNCDKPKGWLIENILSHEIVNKTGLPLVDGLGVITLLFGEKRWNIRFSAENEKTMTVNFNASETTVNLPAPARLSEELQGQFEAFIDFITKLGL